MEEVSQDVYDELTEILRDVFNVDSVEATPDLTAAHVEGWDSLGNVRLFLTVESVYGIRYSAGEISGIENVGQLAQSIVAKRAR